MGVKLLLADKSRTVRKAVQISFRETDTQVAFANNQQELISAIKSLTPDIVLLSSDFPDLDIHNDIRTITKAINGKQIHVLLKSDRSEGIDSTGIQEIGASGLLFSPLDERELKKLISTLLTPSNVKPVQEMETKTQTPVPFSLPIVGEPESAKAVPIEGTVPVVKAADIGYPEQRAQILMEILESYLNENVVLITDALAKNLAPKMAQEVASKILESIDFSDLPFKIATIIEGVIQDLVPQLAEELISREIDQIKEEAARLIESEEQDLE